MPGAAALMSRSRGIVILNACLVEVRVEMLKVLGEVGRRKMIGTGPLQDR